MSLTLFSFLMRGINPDFKYIVFVGSSTLLTYSLHRLVGMKKVSFYEHIGRYAVVKQFRSHIIIYAIISFLLSSYLFFGFDIHRIIYLGLAGLISILYTLPLFGKGRRLRDFSFIKIFLVAGIWAFTTDGLISLEHSINSVDSTYAFIERFVFILAITIPFDIRDIGIDQKVGVRTIPILLGVKRSKKFSLILISIGFLIAFLNPMVVGDTIWALGITYLIVTVLVLYTSTSKNDMWYSGYFEGTMMIPLVTYLLLATF